MVFAPLYGGDIRYHLEIIFDAGPPVSVFNEVGAPFRIVGYSRTARRTYFAAGTEHRGWPNYPNYSVL